MISELQVGVITQTHGIKGEVKVFPTTDDVTRFKKLKEVIMDTDRERLHMEIEGVKFFKQYVIVKFKGYDSINDVERYKNAKLYVTRDKAVQLKKDEYFVADLIGMRVVTEEGETFGTLKDVMATGANDVWNTYFPTATGTGRSAISGFPRYNASPGFYKPFPTWFYR